MRKFFILALIIPFSLTAPAQELNARVTVVSSRVANTVNKNTFVTLQNAVANFLNNRKWTKDVFEPKEKIDCNILINLESTDQPNVYNGFLTIQAARPVFNTDYQSPIINFKDESVAFKYVEYQQLDFNENRVTGNDALASNLTALLAYYANVILAFDYDSFSLRGGDIYFQKAQNIINSSPDARGISGWKAFDGVRNRYWLIENALNPRYEVMHQIYYDYYREGLDQLFSDETRARTAMMGVVNKLDKFNTVNPNSMINQFFLQGKASEFIKIFSKASPPDRSRAVEVLAKYDISNASQYREQLK